MNLKISILSCLLLVTGSVLAGNDELLKAIFYAFKVAGSCGKLYSTTPHEVAYSKDSFGKRLVIFRDCHSVKVFDEKGLCKTAFKIKNDTNNVSSVATLPDGTVVIGFNSGKIKLFDQKTGDCIHAWKAYSSASGPNLLELNLMVNTTTIEDKNYIISNTYDDSTVKVWDLDGNCVKNFSCSSEKGVACVGFVPNVDGNGASVWCGWGSSITVFDWASQKKIAEKSFSPITYGIRQILPNGPHTIVLEGDQIMVFDSKKIECLAKHIFDCGTDYSIMFSVIPFDTSFRNIYSVIPVPGSTCVLIGFESGVIRLFDWMQNKVVWTKKQKLSGNPCGLIPEEGGKFMQVTENTPLKPFYLNKE